MALSSVFQRTASGLSSRSPGATSRWSDSTLEVARWDKMRQAGRRWGWWGGAVGAALGLLVFAPASWMAHGVAQATNGRLLLAQAEGTVWNGSAVAVLSGGPGSRDARALPGRTDWRLRWRGMGLALELSQDCCMASPLALQLRPGWRGVQVSLMPSVQGDRPVAQWPAAWLSGLGAPWNTLELHGVVRLETQGMRFDWAAGRLQVEGQADIVLQDVASRITTLDRLGTYRLSLTAQPEGQMGLQLRTEDGALQLHGDGRVGASGTQFRGEATAREAEQGALNNLLNIIGRRQGDRSVISIG